MKYKKKSQNIHNISPSMQIKTQPNTQPQFNPNYQAKTLIYYFPYDNSKDLHHSIPYPYT